MKKKRKPILKMCPRCCDLVEVVFDDEGKGKIARCPYCKDALYDRTAQARGRKQPRRY